MNSIHKETLMEEYRHQRKKEFENLFASLDIENVKIQFIDYEVDKTVKLKRIIRKVIK